MQGCAGSILARAIRSIYFGSLAEFIKKYGRRAIKCMAVVRIKLWAEGDQRFGSFSASPSIALKI